MISFKGTSSCIGTISYKDTVNQTNLALQVHWNSVNVISFTFVKLKASLIFSLKAYELPKEKHCKSSVDTHKYILYTRGAYIFKGDLKVGLPHYCCIVANAVFV